MILSASAFILDDTDDDGVDGADLYALTYSTDGSTVIGIDPRTYSGGVTIPATSPGGKTVTAIGDRAFAGCTGLTSLTIPEGVTSIGYNAFYNCSGLTSLTIPGSVTSIRYNAFESCTSLTGINVNPANQNYSDVDGVLFNKNKTELKCCPAGKADCTIPENVTSIGDLAFAGCSKLTSLTIPGSVTSIGYDAFESCTSLTGINVNPANQNYSDVDGVLFNKNKTELKCCPAGKADCTIPENVTSIGDLAFAGCSKLTSLTIPGSVTSIRYNAFESCTSLTGINVNPANQNYSDVDGVLFNKNKTELKCCPAGKADCTIPVGVTSIGDLAFYNCSKLTSLTIPGSVTSIGDSAFSGCTGLTSLTIPGSVTNIGVSAFYNCTGLTGTLNIPNGVTSIGDSAFTNCSKLTSLTIPGSVTNIGVYAFYGCTGLTSLTIPGSVKNIGECAFSGCTGLTSLTIPGSVTNIGVGAFDGCTGLTSLTISNGVTSIGASAFYGCSGLTCALTIPNSVTSIGASAFYGCSGLTSLTIPGSVKNIGEYAFSGCSGLTGALTISNSVTNIGVGAFRDCTGLTSCTVTGSPTAGGILEKYFTAAGGWKLPGMSTAFSTLTIDSDKALDLTNVAGSAGKSVKFTAESKNTIGGDFLRAAGSEPIVGGERAGLTFKHDGTNFRVVLDPSKTYTVNVTIGTGGTVSYKIDGIIQDPFSSPITAKMGQKVTLIATVNTPTTVTYRFGGWTVDGVLNINPEISVTGTVSCKVSFEEVKIDTEGNATLEFQGGLKVELSTADLGSNYIGLRETSVPGYQKAFELTAPGLDGKTLKVTIPFDPIRGHTPSVCFLDPNGPVPMRIIEVTATSITFETDHNSTYVLRYVPIPNNNHTPDEPAVNPPTTVVPSGKEPVEEDDGALYVIAAAAAAIAVLLVATYNLYGRK